MLAIQSDLANYHDCLFIQAAVALKMTGIFQLTWYILVRSGMFLANVPGESVPNVNIRSIRLASHVCFDLLVERISFACSY